MQDLEEYRYLSTELRHLIIDTVLNANSGHLGMPLGMADIATVLFKDFLHFDPNEPTHPLRDRFILSCGHGSSLLYSILYLCGYEGININDLKNFRQLNSNTPGHPEFNKNLGIETTTGPLGQGIANAVGMAIEQKKLKAIFKDYDELDYKIYVFASDGDVMEGISHEALSFAGTNKLSNLIIFLDNNKITIDGPLSKSCTENYEERFKSYNFYVQTINGHDFDEIKTAISNSVISDKPSIIICNTIIGRGIVDWEGTSKIHGSIPSRYTLKNLNFDKQLNIEKTTQNTDPDDTLDTFYNCDENNDYKNNDYQNYTAINSVNNWDDFFVQQDALNTWRSFCKKGIKKFSSLYYLENKIKKLKNESNISNCIKDSYEIDLSDNIYQTLSTKECFNKILNLAKSDNLIGGSADLTSSNGTKSKNMQDFSSENYSGNYINYGIREHAMGAIINGINAGGIFRAFSGTFLSFSDYMRPAIRLAALMNINSIFVFSHDSIFIGHDGPTHQPIEQLDSLRLIPNLNVWRPCDYQETLESFKCILRSESPSALILSRQKIKNSHQYGNIDSLLAVPCGGYIISDFDDKVENSNGDVINYTNVESFKKFNKKILCLNPHIKKIILVATGSEVHLCFEIKEFLSKFGLHVRIVSIPCFEIFEQQPKEYKEKLLNYYNSLNVFIEASTGMCFYKYVKKSERDFVVNLNSFGKSASEKDLRNEFAFDPLSISNDIIQKAFL